jgi:hypothetical protein
MRVGYFCTAGFTELNGIEPFLRRINPDVEWVRCFPATRKMPYPRPQRSDDPKKEHIPVPAHSGSTGEELIRQLLECWPYWKNQCDAWLLIDDLDCRFCSEGGVSKEAWLRRLEQRLQAAQLPSMPILLLASPEIEAWMIADFEEGFQWHLKNIGYAGLAFPFQEWLKNRLAGTLEAYGCPHQDQGCCHKISEEIQGWFFSQTNILPSRPQPDRLEYSKRFDGPKLLARLRPEKVAEHCPLYFKPAYQELKDLK